MTADAVISSPHDLCNSPGPVEASTFRHVGALDRQVVIVTGAGHGVGRGHALFFAAEGAEVSWPTTSGATPDGTGADASPARQVADEIMAAGGEAVANHASVGELGGGRGTRGQGPSMLLGFFTRWWTTPASCEVACS